MLAEYENYAITKERKDAFICKWNDKNSANFRIFRQIDGLLVYMQFDEFFHFSKNVFEKKNNLTFFNGKLDMAFFVVIEIFTLLTYFIEFKL